jgi:hypothetical protein
LYIVDKKFNEYLKLYKYIYPNARTYVRMHAFNTNIVFIENIVFNEGYIESIIINVRLYKYMKMYIQIVVFASVFLKYCIIFENKYIEKR